MIPIREWSGPRAGDYTVDEIQKETEVLSAPVHTAAEKRYLRKLNFIILPTISLLYFFEYLDRGNVAVGTSSYLLIESFVMQTNYASQNAKLYGLDSGHSTSGNGVGPGAKSLTSKEWQLNVMIFYVGLVLFQIPGCIGYRIFSPSRVSVSARQPLLLLTQQQWIAFGVCGWSVASLLQCLAFDLGGELVCRIFLGVFEGLFGTGIIYYLSLWYHRTELGLRVFWFLGPTAIAG